MARPLPMIYSQDFLLILHIFFYIPDIRNFWGVLYFRISLLAQIFRENKVIANKKCFTVPSYSFANRGHQCNCLYFMFYVPVHFFTSFPLTSCPPVVLFQLLYNIYLFTFLPLSCGLHVHLLCCFSFCTTFTCSLFYLFPADFMSTCCVVSAFVQHLPVHFLTSFLPTSCPPVVLVQVFYNIYLFTF